MSHSSWRNAQVTLVRKRFCSLATRLGLPSLPYCFTTSYPLPPANVNVHNSPTDDQLTDLHIPADSSLALKCITFGSPPFCNTEFASLTNQTQIKTKNCHLHLNFLNEIDVVPRLDKSYVLSLVDLYRSKFGLPPENTDNDIHGSVPHGYESSDKIGASKTWPLHAPVFVHPGNTILLSLEDAANDKSEVLKLRATQVNHPTLGSLLFCRIAAHKIAVYLANIQELCARDS